jgi:hypothetical protein
MEIVQFVPRTEPCLKVYRRGQLVWQGGKRIWQAWKLQFIDLDDDRYCEFVLGVYRATRFYPANNSLYVLGWNGRYAYRKWMGSRMAGWLHDFALARFRPDQPVRLATLERDSAGQPRVRVYRWSGFGFVVCWQSQPLPATGRLQPMSHQVLLTIGRRRYRLYQPSERMEFALQEVKHAKAI